ncbi:hypothetical protein PsorP6_005137 [Peronosclerospora sorghi]|uniref:Uncharacterized protein n=1 Tax=Peronosclerospora sorghi TaxID=230839 RepID=A0ACC0W725_9STRA|nr:hypothetical protein PsorP6_005137 [Peronosclerospora sorghi]
MEENDVYVREEGDRPVEHSPRGRYIRFDIRLGTGAYKSVYKAYDTDQGIDVAWNAIDIGLLPSTEKTRIIQEVQLLQKLEHKNIINFYGSWFSKEKNQVVFITEIMTSGTLKSYIKRVQFIKWKIIKRWCIQILEGLHYLHSQNPPVIHRDLKCDNIFVNGNTGDLRIGDLGLSTQLAVDKRLKAQSVLGTPEFMAPELYDESYDEKVDIYAFGMCVLEMVTKEVPYSECINPAQIYKKVTAGIRPKGLQRVVSQAARDFIELCLSRGNGLVDVTAEYLLNHAFLKAQDDDNDMVECLSEHELEIESKKMQQRLEQVAEESFEVEINMESGSKVDEEVASGNRQRQSVSFDASVVSAGGDSATIAANAENTSLVASTTPLKEEMTQRLTEVPPAEATGGDSMSANPASSSDLLSPKMAASSSPPTVTPTPPSAAPTPALTRQSTPPTDALNNLTLSPSQPVISEMVGANKPLSSGKETTHTHVDQFLATLPGTESAIQNTRMNIMGGRGQRLDLENDIMPEYIESPTESLEVNANENTENMHGVSADASSKVDPSKTAPGMLAPSEPPESQAPFMQLPERKVDVQASLTRRASIHGPFEATKAAAALNQPISHSLSRSTTMSGTSTHMSHSISQSTTMSGTTTRKRVKGHEIKAAKDPDNEHSILLNLRIIIDGKSKEIKFPFNLFADSPHEVACELAVDVGILEPNLEDIADSIRFLVTEGKINNLSDVQEDVWEEAPEPHSFSSIPFPNVSKMSFVQLPSGATFLQQQGYLMSNSPLERTASMTNVLNAGVAPPSLSTSTSAQPGLMMTQNGSDQELGNSAPVKDPSSTLMLHENGGFPPGNTSTSAPLPFSGNEMSCSPPRPGFVHAANESTFTKEALRSILEMRAGGMSMGSTADPTYVQQIHQLEDRIKMARTSFDERESSLEAAIRSEEEKHQREIERFRKKMEEFDKQRAAIARQQNGEGVMLNDANGSSATLDNNWLLAQGEAVGNANVPNPLVGSMEFDSNVGLPVDGFDEELSALPQLASTVSTNIASPQRNPMSEAVASVPVDELIPESYLQFSTQSSTQGNTRPAAALTQSATRGQTE